MRHLQQQRLPLLLLATPVLVLPHLLLLVLLPHLLPLLVLVLVAVTVVVLVGAVQVGVHRSTAWWHPVLLCSAPLATCVRTTTAGAAMHCRWTLGRRPGMARGREHGGEVGRGKMLETMRSVRYSCIGRRLGESLRHGSSLTVVKPPVHNAGSTVVNPPAHGAGFVDCGQTTCTWRRFDRGQTAWALQLASGLSLTKKRLACAPPFLQAIELFLAA